MRRVDRSVNAPCGYVVAQDRAEWDIPEEDLCKCGFFGYRGPTLVCVDCGTVYGVAQFKSFRSGWSRLNWDVCF